MKPVPPVTRTGRSASGMLALLVAEGAREPAVAVGGGVGQLGRILRPAAEVGQLGGRRQLGEEVARRALPRADAAERDRLEETHVAPAAGEAVGEDLVDGLGRGNAVLDDPRGL